jgi:hypothetical protein
LKLQSRAKAFLITNSQEPQSVKVKLEIQCPFDDVIAGERKGEEEEVFFDLNPQFQIFQRGK